MSISGTPPLHPTSTIDHMKCEQKRARRSRRRRPDTKSISISTCGIYRCLARGRCYCRWTAHNLNCSWANEQFVTVEAPAEDCRTILIRSRFYTTSHTIKINEEGIPNVTSIDRATPALLLIWAPSVKDSTSNARSDNAPAIEQSIQDTRCNTSTHISA